MPGIVPSYAIADGRRLASLLACALVVCATRGAAGKDAEVSEAYRKLLLEGNRLYAEGEYTRAEESYLEAKNDSPDAAAPLFNIGNTYFAREDYPRAIESYLEALGSVRDDRELEARIRYNLATARVRESEKTIGDLTDPEKLQTGIDFLREAIGGYRDVLQIDPEHEDARHNLFVAQVRVKKLLDDLKRAREAAEKETPEGESPLELVKQLIEEEKAEIGLTREAIQADREASRVGDWLERVEAVASAIDEPTQRSQTLESLRELEMDPDFAIGAAEVSRARRALGEPGGGGPQAARQAVADAVERLQAEKSRHGGARDETIEKDLADQRQTAAKARGVAQGLRDAAAGKGPAQAVQPGQPTPPQPAPQPPPPEVAGPMSAAAGWVEQAATDMESALRSLEGEDVDFEKSAELAARILADPTGKVLEQALERSEARAADGPPAGDTDAAQDGASESAGEAAAPARPLTKALRAQLEALAKLRRALEELEKLPREEPPPSGDQEKQNQGDMPDENTEADQEAQGEGDEESQEGDDSQDESGEEGESQEEQEEEEDGQEGESQGEQDQQQDGSESAQEEEGQQGAESRDADELTKEEAERLLRRFLQDEAARERERKERLRRGAGRGRSLEKDW